jgi:polyhydroxyalkanoate synthesis regulator protein
VTPLKRYKRYGNRKFYDLETHRYVNLKEIYNTVKSGANISVIGSDKDGNELDLTGSTLKSLMKGQVVLSNQDMFDLIRRV